MRLWVGRGDLELRVWSDGSLLLTSAMAFMCASTSRGPLLDLAPVDGQEITNHGGHPNQLSLPYSWKPHSSHLLLRNHKNSKENITSGYGGGPGSWWECGLDVEAT